MDLIHKTEAARLQLDQAIRLFVDHQDYICSLTLAAAAEELLGKQLQRRGDKPSITAFTDLCMLIAQMAREKGEPEPARRTFADMANDTRNNLKHFGNPDEDHVLRSRGEAASIIERAISNYIQLTRSVTAEISRFQP